MRHSRAVINKLKRSSSVIVCLEIVKNAGNTTVGSAVVVSAAVAVVVVVDVLLLISTTTNANDQMQIKID